MRLLIIGFNGFVGRSIALQACARGLEVVGIGRSERPKFQSDATYVSGDRSDPNQISRIVQDRGIDVVVDVIAMVVADTQPLLDRLDGKVSQYVLISSSDVYANYERLHKRVNGKACLDAVDEDSDLRSALYPYREGNPRSEQDPDRYLDDYDKIPIEAAVRKLSSPWTILRLPMVYGPGDRQRRFRWAISPMLRKQQALIIPRSWANWQSTYGYVENVGAAVAATLGHPQARNTIFNIAEETPVSQLAWAQKFAKATGWQGPIEVTDDPNDPFHGRISGLDLSVPFKIDGARLRRLLDFSDVVDEPTALRRTVESEAQV